MAGVAIGLLLGGCGSSGITAPPSSGQAGDSSVNLAATMGQTPATTAAPSGSSGLSFKAMPLSGYSGAIAIMPGTNATVGTTNTNGTLSVQVLSSIGLDTIYSANRTTYDVRSADFNGDGIPDVISTVYQPTTTDGMAQLYFGSASGVYTQDTTFGLNYLGNPNGPGYRGRTEAIVAADFNNDGAVDLFLPTYTFLDSQFDESDEFDVYYTSGTPPNVRNALQNYLLLNDGTGHFTEHAVQAGVSMHSTLSGIKPDSADPNGNQPEGTQAVDFNMDGLIDFYAGGHLYINQGVDAKGVPHFSDMAPAYGLTRAVLARKPVLWVSAGPGSLSPTALATDEGAKFIDWNNDGKLDLLLLRWDWGPANGARIFEFTGSQFVERITALTSPTETCKNPAASGSNTAFFQTARAPETNSAMAGINAYDLDNDGLEDVLTMGDPVQSNAVFRNTGCGFVEVGAGDLQGLGSGAGSMAFADIDNDGWIDVLYPANTGAMYYLNQSKGNGNASFTVDVRGPNGEANQFGRVVQVLPPGSKQIFTRVVDGGSGYLSQSQYAILIGTPFRGSHQVKVYYAPLRTCSYGGAPCKPVVLTFPITPGKHATTFAPSASYPSGRVVVN